MSELSFWGKVVIVTGAASGIGAATARLFLARGAQVLGVDRDAAGLSALMKLAGTEKLATMTADISVEPDVVAYIAKAMEYFGKLDILINNAGMEIGFKPIQNIAIEDAQRVLQVNVIGTFLGMKHGIKAMVESGGGAIVNVGSVSGMVGTYGQAMYSASKAAVLNMSRAAAAENGAGNIRINCVAPGPVETPLLYSVAKSAGLTDFDVAEASGGRLAIQRMGQPIEIARVIAFLASDEASYVTGAVYTADGGFTAV